jgi:dynein heavy chain, axonemal
VLEGARWDEKTSQLDNSRPKELFATMPIILIKAVTLDKVDTRDVYACPVYRTQQRGPTYVFTAGLKTKAPAIKWILAGVAVLMEVVY